MTGINFYSMCGGNKKKVPRNSVVPEIAQRLQDQLFISLAEELRNQTDDLANATPEGEPWEVVLPTTLVYLWMLSCRFPMPDHE